MILRLALLAAAAVAAADVPAPAAAAVPLGAPGVAELKERFVAAMEPAARADLIERIARTAPVSARDVAALFDLFSRVPDVALRRQVMESLRRMPEDSPQLEPLFIEYLRQPEPESRLFGINGAFRLRSRRALPLVRRIAESGLPAAGSGPDDMLTQRNVWWVQYEALSALAQWEGEKSLRLLRRKAGEHPDVARLLGRYFWRRTLPDLRAWAASANPADRTRAVEAARAPIDVDAARATRDGMLALLRDPAADEEVRHQLALKVGASSTDAEVDALAAEHDRAANDRTRLLWAAAVFAAHSPKSVPLLVRYARQSADETMRRGARAELVDLVGEDQTVALLDAKK